MSELYVFYSFLAFVILVSIIKGVIENHIFKKKVDNLIKENKKELDASNARWAEFNKRFPNE